MTIREWSRTVGLTRGDVERMVVVRKASVPGRVVFVLPPALARARPRAMLAALEARFPLALAPLAVGEPIGTRFVRTVRRILTMPALAPIKSALRMEYVTA